MPMNDAPRLYTVRETATHLRIAPKSVRRRIRARQLLATRPRGARAWLIPESEIKRVLNEGIQQ